VSLDFIQSERDPLAGEMDSQSLSFTFVEPGGLEQLVTEGRTPNDSVATKPATSKRDLRCKDKETISVRCKVLYHDAVTCPALDTVIALGLGSRLGDRWGQTHSAPILTRCRPPKACFSFRSMQPMKSGYAARITDLD
jgi:hypothetical protein